jgi:hypothetical protein
VIGIAGIATEMVVVMAMVNMVVVMAMVNMVARALL